MVVSEVMNFDNTKRRICLRVSLFVILLSVLFSMWSCRSDSKTQETSITVAAAADLGQAFEEIAKSFEQATGTKVVLSLGSTGLLEKQIENGAPMDVFAAANVSFIDELGRKGLILPD